MAKNFVTTVETAKGPRVVHVNRRGCKGRWTDEDQKHLTALVDAAIKMRDTAAAPRPTTEDDNG